MMTNKTAFYWDERIQYGSREHYWHFIFGYFLPLVDQLLNSELVVPHSITISDCGPIMNKILKNMSTSLGIKVFFSKGLVVKSNEQIKISKEKIILERYDLLLLNPNFHEYIYSKFINIKKGLERYKSSLECCSYKCDNKKLKTSFLVIKRSPEPDYYKDSGSAEIKGYGEGRRVFSGLDEGVEYLNSIGIQSLIYSPGSHTLFCQMRYFSECKGIIGIRGAEFANLVWMKEGSFAYMFFHNIDNPDPPQRKLANLLNIKFFEIGSAEKDIKLNPLLIKN